MKSLSVKNLKIGYGPCVLAEVEELQLEAGRAYPLVGDNGAGKSTLLRSLAGLQPLLGGDVYYGECALSEFKLNELSEYRAFLFTERPRQAWLTVRDILLWSLPSLHSLKKDIFHEVIEFFGIRELLPREFTHLSDGQMQKVMLARAFVQDTEILFLDEPTIFLDIRIKYEVLELIEKWAREKEKLIVYSTHEWGWVSRQAREVLYVENSERIINKEDPRSLIERGIYPEV